MHLENPKALVEAAFRRIQRERMADMPMLNPALIVEAVDFDKHDGHWLGVLVTPWTMTLMLLPAGKEGWVSAPEGRRLMIRYPAGEFAFLGGHEQEIGEYLSCPLFASMAQFPDQETARFTARASLIALMLAASSDPGGDKVESPSRRRLFLRGS